MELLITSNIIEVFNKQNLLLLQFFTRFLARIGKHNKTSWLMQIRVENINQTRKTLHQTLVIYLYSVM